MSPAWNVEIAAVLLLLLTAGAVAVGLLVGSASRRGRWRRLVLGLQVAELGGAAVAGALGLVALMEGWSAPIWKALLLIGAVLVPTMLLLLWNTRDRYRRHEGRRLQAEELRRS